MATVNMDEQVKSNLERVAVVIAPAVAAFSMTSAEIAAFKQAMEALANKELAGITQVDTNPATEYLDILAAIESLREFIDGIGEEKPLLIERKLPRPPRRLGPVNRTNYQANRPPRVARSSCRIIKR